VKCSKAYVIQCSYKFYENVLIPSVLIKQDKQENGWIHGFYVHMTIFPCKTCEVALSVTFLNDTQHTGVDKIMETLHNIGIKLFVLVALKEH